MAYQALYRTYRPQFFRDVVGQEVVIKTLQNAIQNNKISHAYLFSGPRGTGKTTIARIFAKALNCENLTLNEPCNSCTSCLEITDGVSVDVIEIDGASNSGVDEIREIREKAKFLPSGANYKVYIIDEVHMLTGAAFNALLKTLEEPPAHVVFILATTEPQKIPSTILSRCQRFEFKALTINEISKQLRKICNDENVEITQEALTAISEGAEGALRDALTTLDQAISYSNDKVGIEEVNLVLGSLSYDKLIELAQKFEDQDITTSLEIVHDLIDKGKEVDKIVNGLLKFYHDMLLYKNVSSVVYSKYIFEKPAFQELAQKVSDDRIYYYVEVLSEVLNQIKTAQSPNLYLEIALIKLVNTSDMSLNYLSRLNDLEQKVAMLELPQSSGGLNPEDLERININEVKLNRVISELNKLELNKLSERVRAIESMRLQADSSDKVEEALRELEELKEQFAVTKANVLALKSRSEGASQAPAEVDLSPIEGRIDRLEKFASQLPNFRDNDIELTSMLTQDHEEKLVDLQKEVEGLKAQISGLENRTVEVYPKEEISNFASEEASKVQIASIEREREVDVQKDVATKTDEEVDEVTSSLINDLRKENAGEDARVEVSETKDNSPTIADMMDAAYSSEEKEAEIEEPVVTVEEEKEELESEENASESEEEKSYIETEEGSEVENDSVSEEEFEEELGEEAEDAEETLETSQAEEVETKVEETEAQAEPSIEAVEEIKVEDASETEEETEETKPLESQRPNQASIFEFENKVEKQEEADIDDASEEVDEKLEEVSAEEIVKASAPKEEKIVHYDPVEEIRKQNEYRAKENVDRYNSYDVHFVEEILRDSRTESARNDFSRIKNVWTVIGNYPAPQYKGVVSVLARGKVVACGNREFIIVFDNATLCNQAMSLTFKRSAMEVMKVYLKYDYNYIALPERVWLEKRTEYISQYNLDKTREPRLSPINDPELFIIDSTKEYKDPNENVINGLKDLFGDKVKIK